MSDPPRWFTNRLLCTLNADEHGTPAREIELKRFDRAPSDGHDPLLGALAACAQHPLLQVHLGELEPDRLGDAQPACIHQLEQRPVAQSQRLGALGLGEQLPDLLAREHLRQALGLRRSTQLGGRIVLDQAFATQVTIERAQTGRLALQRRGCHRDALFAAASAAARKLGEKRRQVAVLGIQRRDSTRGQEHAELREV